MNAVTEILYEARNDVSSSTIRNCFLRTGLRCPAMETPEEDVGYDLVATVRRRLNVNDVVNDEFVLADNNAAVESEFTDSSITTGISQW